MSRYEFRSVEPIKSVVELVEKSACKYETLPAARYKKGKHLCEKSYIDLRRDVMNIADRLRSCTTTGKVHVAVLGRTSYEWLVSFLGINYAGFTAVPLDCEASAEKLLSLMFQADAEYLLYADEYENIAEYCSEYSGGIITCKSFQNLLASSEEKNFDYKEQPEALSAIVFTSGTTGKEKGVMLTQNNIVSNAVQVAGAFDVRTGQETVLYFLPLSHVYGLTGAITMIYLGICIHFSSGLRYVQKELREVRPSMLVIVPLVAETFYKNIEATVRRQNRERVFKLALEVSQVLRHLHIDATDFFFRDVKLAFGGNLRWMTCGGAPIRDELVEKYHSMGINLVQGYGLSECSPCLATNLGHYYRKGSVGKVVPGDEVKIVEGEIWARGVSVFSGYYNDPTETDQAFEDGWFKTGDLGDVDSDGFIFLKGRKKNLIILSNGENVAAEEMENMVLRIGNVSEVIVYGKDNRIVAEIYSENHSEQAVKMEIDRLNRRLPSYKQIDEVIFREAPFEKTSSRKIKRDHQ